MLEHVGGVAVAAAAGVGVLDARHAALDEVETSRATAHPGNGLAIRHSDTARRRRLRPGTQGGPVYPAVYRIRPLADPEVAYAASGIASWRASTTSDCPSTETATCPPD